jgi:hypothetical protein
MLFIEAEGRTARRDVGLQVLIPDEESAPNCTKNSEKNPEPVLLQIIQYVLWG